MLKKLLAPLAMTITLAAAMAGSALAAVAPDVLVRDLSVKIIDAVKADPAIQAGDIAVLRLNLVDRLQQAGLLVLRHDVVDIGFRLE